MHYDLVVLQEKYPYGISSEKVEWGRSVSCVDKNMIPDLQKCSVVIVTAYIHVVVH